MLLHNTLIISCTGTKLGQNNKKVMNIQRNTQLIINDLQYRQIRHRVGSPQLTEREAIASLFLYPRITIQFYPGSDIKMRLVRKNGSASSFQKINTMLS